VQAHHEYNGGENYAHDQKPHSATTSVIRSQQVLLLTVPQPLKISHVSFSPILDLPRTRINRVRPPLRPEPLQQTQNDDLHAEASFVQLSTVKPDRHRTSKAN
jgi:hypothetical protein